MVVEMGGSRVGGEGVRMVEGGREAGRNGQKEGAWGFAPTSGKAACYM